jgi:hypothetical protein
MFAYFTKNNKNAIVSLYFNYYNDDECLYNTQPISNWINNYNAKLVSFIPCDEYIEYRSNNNIILLFSYS